MTKTSKIDSVNGFTLIELLVAIAILSIISISCYTAFDTALKSWRMSEARVERYQNARAALEMMARELQSSFILTANGTYRLLETANSIYFTTSAITTSGNIYEIGYVRNNNVLLRQIDTTPDGDLTNGDDTSELAQGIIGLEFDHGYYSDSGRTAWVWDTTTAWNSTVNNVGNYDKSGQSKSPDGLPEAIRIGLAVRDVKSYEAIQSFYTIVYISNAE